MGYYRILPLWQPRRDYGISDLVISHMDDLEDTAELRNPFPSPPSHYALYTPHNLRLLSLLKERDPQNSINNQSEILSDQTEVPDWPLTQLEKPRVDWILDEPDAYYDVFGDRWFVCRHSLFKSIPLQFTKLRLRKRYHR